MANSDNIKNDAALVDVSQIKAINKVSFKQRMKAYKRKPLSLVPPSCSRLNTTATMYRVCRQLSTQLFLRL